MMTRWLFFVLLLLNGLLFLWGYQQPAPPSSTPRPLPADTPGIQLLSEFVAEKKPAMKTEMPADRGSGEDEAHRQASEVAEILVEAESREVQVDAPSLASAVTELPTETGASKVQEDAARLEWVAGEASADTRPSSETQNDAPSLEPIAEAPPNTEPDEAQENAPSLRPAATEVPTETYSSEVQDGAKRLNPATEASLTNTDQALKQGEAAAHQNENHTSCVRLGPFKRQAVATALIAEFDEAQFDTSIEQKTQPRQSGYWVLANAEGKTPKQLMTHLKSAGVSDVWRFTKGELTGAVSLGLYMRRSRANRRQRDVQKKGITADIRPRMLEDTLYWVQATYDNQRQEAAGQLEQMFNQYPKLKYPPELCTEVAKAAPIP